jgi:cytochrome c556
MTKLARCTILAVLGGAVAACGPRDAPEADAEPVVLRTSMTDVVKPQTELVLNVLIDALSEPPDPAVDPAKLTDTHWEIMATAAAALRDEAVALRDRPIRVVAAPGEAILNEELEGAATAADVQTHIDEDPDGFGAHAEELRLDAEAWLAAIEARDGAAMWRTALTLDPTCVACHEAFWVAEEEEHEDEDHDDDHQDLAP